MSELKYNVGDKVRIKSLDWYNENKDINGNVYCGFKLFTYEMSKFCGYVMTVCNRTNLGVMTMYGSASCWTDEMIEGLVEEETKLNIIEEAKTYWDSIKDAWVCPEGYAFKDENGNIINATKIVLEKKKKQYPKTYEECCKVLNLPVRDFDILYNMLDTTETIYSNNLDRLLNSFRKLLICRDAYWKIAGEEMGLGKPWEPDFTDKYSKSYVITAASGIIHTTWTNKQSYILAFPTAEMRDAFKENFDPDIEICQELL